MDVGSGEGCENLKLRENRRVSLQQFEQINERTISTACGRKGSYAMALLNRPYCQVPHLAVWERD